MTREKHMKIKKIGLAIMPLFLATVVACKKDQDPEIELAEPAIENIEIGLNNNEIGIIGKDFHFNADVVAGEKIEFVQISILPRKDESYDKPWKLELDWVEFKGAKKVTVHKHFNIPQEAVEGKYDFTILVKDQNGTKKEVIKRMSLYTETNLPVNPNVFLVTVMADKRVIYDQANGGFLDPVTNKYGNGRFVNAKGDNLVP